MRPKDLSNAFGQDDTEDSEEEGKPNSKKVSTSYMCTLLYDMSNIFSHFRFHFPLLITVMAYVLMLSTII